MPDFFRDITAPYGAFEAWFYDRFIAPAVAGLFEGAGGAYLDRVGQPAEILDVGCGGGHEIGILAGRWPAARLCGIDLNRGQVARALRRVERFGARVSIVEGDALALPFATGRFDFVLSAGSIKHWPDAARGLAECVRVLRSGARLIVLDVDRGCRHEDALAFVRRWRTPAFAKPIDLMFFRTWVAGRSLDRDELARLAEAVPLGEWRIERPTGMPVLLLEARKS